MAGQRVMSLYGELGLNASSFNKGLSKAEGNFKSAGSSMESDAKKAAGGIEDTFEGMAKDVGSSFDLMGSVATGMFTGMTTTMLDLATGMVTGIVSTITGAATAPLSLADDYNTAMSMMETKTGTFGEELETLTGIARGVWKDGFGENITEAADVISMIHTRTSRFTNMFEDEMSRMAEGVFGLSDAWDLDYKESVDAAAVLMEQFGLSGDEAMGFITEGLQRGLNSSGDFLDSIREYSNQFAAGDLSASQFFSAMETGIAGGVMGTDKVSDAIKEMNILFLEGNQGMKDGMSALGLSYDSVFAQVQSGSMSQAEALQMIIDRMSGLDEVNQKVIAAQVFGTMGEDLVGILPNLDLMASGYDEWGNSMDGLNAQYSTLGAIWTDVSRDFLDALIPIGEAFRVALIDQMPLLEQFFAWFAETATPVLTEFAIQAAASLGSLFTWLMENGMPILDQLFNGFFGEEGSEGVGSFVTTAIGFLGGLWTAFTTGFGMIQIAWTWWDTIAKPVVNNWVDWATTKFDEISKWWDEEFWPSMQDTWKWWNEEAAPQVEEFTGKVMGFLSPIIEFFHNQLMAGLDSAWKWWNETAWPVIDEFIGNVQPIFERWFDNLNSLMDRLKPIWENAWADIGDAVVIFQDTLADLLDIFGIEGPESADAMEFALLAVESVLNGILLVIEGGMLIFRGFSFWLKSISEVAGFVAHDIGVVKDLFDSLPSPIEAIGTALGNVAEDFKWLADQAILAWQMIPDGLKPGSLPPFAVGLMEIANAAGQAADMFTPFSDKFSDIGENVNIAADQVVRFGELTQGGSVSNNTTNNRSAQVNVSIPGGNVTQSTVSMLKMAESLV